MINPFEEIVTKLDQIIAMNDKILLSLTNPVDRKIEFNNFCKDFNISRPTAYAWGKKGLIKIEKIGGRNYVHTDSITIDKKWQRKHQS